MDNPNNIGERAIETTQPRAGANRTRFLAALVAGLIVFTLLFQWGGSANLNEDTCYSMFAWFTVPCGGGVAVAAGAATSLIVWLVLWLRDRWRQ